MQRENEAVLSDIVQCYSGKNVLDHVNLEVKGGDIAGLLGPSGAGKTTIIKILTGQLRQTFGTSQIMGKDSRSLRGSDYRKIGMMMDCFGLYERLSVYDNLKLFARIRFVPLSEIEKVLRATGLLEAKKCMAAKLSKGMKIRLAFARAVLGEPELLFLDEPTSGLDPSTAGEIHRMIYAEKERGATVFLTTHNMAEAEKLCGHIMLLNEGKIVEEGRPEEICARYNHLDKINIRLKNGEVLTVDNNGSGAEVVKRCLETETIKSIHSTEPNLETVFMELTGRRFD